jgi:hypothetical protein
MLSLYRGLLYLYPASYRRGYGDEMAGVFGKVHTETWGRGLRPRVQFLLREFAGLLHGAFEERLRAIAGSHAPLSIPSSSGRFTMRSEFRFPKATPILMAIILAGVILTIEKATAIEQSLPHGYPQQLAPIQPEHFPFFTAMAVIFLSAYAMAVIGWVVLFALRRSGVHRLSEMPAGATSKTVDRRD